ncbi:SGNH/GDSL hydrolase family protein [Magnetovibrio sp.]|uniref:SGNH/GDSL hydrolase family protein n=1 Tax=Magnetovibrio sp. TaxID=2024836 RepID=UPI002F91EE8C
MMRHLNLPLIILLNILTALAFLEGMLRVVEPVPLTGYQYQPCIFAYDDQLGYRFKAGAIGRTVRFHEINNVVKINDIGFHDLDRKAVLETTDAYPRPIRILAFGDSFTAGVEVPVEDGWTQKLERELMARRMPHAATRSIEVINLGLGGTGTDIHLKLMKEWVHKLKPDLVVLAFFFNDVGDNWRKTIHYSCYKDFVLGFQFDHQVAGLKETIDQKYPSTFLTQIYRSLYTVQALNFYLHFAPNINVEWAKPVVAKDIPIGIDKLFAQMHEVVKKVGAEFVVIPVPPRQETPPLPESFNVARQPAADARVALLDVRPEIQNLLSEYDLRPSDMYWQHDGHFNRQGHDIFARATANKLWPRIRILLNAENSAH